IEVIDNLMATFPSPITFTVVSVKSGALLSLNNAYDGKSIINLLGSNNALNTGAKESITLTVNYSSNGSSNNSLFNTATAITKDNLGHQLSIDISQNGSNADPNGNGNPNETGENEVTYFAPAVEIDSVEVEFSIPQGFSPNGDGVNDLFVIRGLSKYPNNELSMFNRWGNVVYKMKGYDNTWNGKVSEGIHYGSDDLPEGTYFFVFDLGNGKIHKGYIYLNRAVK
ncbi:MAG: gliding motility-associated C-terminal domain-containing protein, partial [Bacteroidota bacterium]